MNEDGSSPGGTFFIYWGRRGAMSWFALELARVLAQRGHKGACISVSSSNELASVLLNEPLVEAFPTFRKMPGAITNVLDFLRAAGRLVARLKDQGYRNVVVLMPHVWSPFLGTLVRRSGLRYAIIIHDAQRHPGDVTGFLNRWLMHDVRKADSVITLSKSVTQQLTEKWRVAEDRILTLFHPTFTYGDEVYNRRQHEPLRVLFFGRIMAYKGLDLLVSAIEQLRARGIKVQLGVFGEGNLGALLPRLRALEADVVNRWIDHGQVSVLLATYDIVALPYREASQSGAAAAALGGGLPVVATPVGGLAEQIQHNVNGLLAEDVTAESLASALASLAVDKDLYQQLRNNCLSQRHQQSMVAFLEALLAGLHTASDAARKLDYPK